MYTSCFTNTCSRWYLEGGRDGSGGRSEKKEGGGGGEKKGKGGMEAETV